MARFNGGGGAIQQVVVRFAPDLDHDRIARAWQDTVRATEALQTGFSICDGVPVGLAIREVRETLRIGNDCPDHLEHWLAEDRLQPLSFETGVPWRCVFWPGQRLWIWTFHHALLDGRSIAEILRGFRFRLEGDSRAGPLALKQWSPPAADEIAAAGAFYQSAFSRLEPFEPDFPGDAGSPGGCLQQRLGAKVAEALEFRAGEMDVTAPVILTWAWGQAAALVGGLDAVAIGQVRAGAPQDGRAGFSMNTVPVVVRRCRNREPGPALRSFRAELHRLRPYELVAHDDLSGVGFVSHGGPWRGGVVMVEHGTLAKQVGIGGAFTAIEMHERSGDPLLACARIRPELELEVEFDGCTRRFG